jgi:CP family cyanate transporter-like MFS transporter
VTDRRPSLALLAAIVLLGINLRTVIASLPPLLPAVRDDLGLSAGVAGLLTTLPLLCFGALAPVAPRLGRRMSLEAILAACAALTAAAAAVRGIGSTPALFAGSLLAGVAVAVAQAALPVLIRIAFPGAIGLLTGAYSMALPIGATLGAGAAVPLEDALGGSWAASLASWALPAVAAAVLWGAAAMRRRTTITGPPPDPLRGERLAWAVAAYFGAQAAAFYATLAWLPEILESYDWSAEAAGGLLALCALVSVPPAFAIPVLAGRRRTQTTLMIVIAVIAAVGVAGLLVAPGLAVLWVVLIGIGQGGSLGLALVLPVLRATSSGVVAALTAMVLCVGFLLGATGPWLLGVAHDLSGDWAVPLLVLLVITVLQVVPGLAASRARVLEPAPAN